MTFETALELDISGQIEAAAEAYEEVINSQNGPVAAYINLACLYWECTDFGFSVGHGMEPSFMENAGKRMYEVLEEARKKFGDQPEILFWRLYFDFTYLGEDMPPVAKCLELVELPEATLVPYFHVYVQTMATQYLPQARQLLELAKKEKTVKNRYIISVLESRVPDG